MSDTTQFLGAPEQGDPHAATRLPPRGHDELRKLAAQRLAWEQPGQTLQLTALVHEAYLRLVGQGDPGWRSFVRSSARGEGGVALSARGGADRKALCHRLSTRMMP
jgi:hypothetical protein